MRFEGIKLLEKEKLTKIVLEKYNKGGMIDGEKLYLGLCKFGISMILMCLI
jgi:hypothetical protein